MNDRHRRQKICFGPVGQCLVRAILILSLIGVSSLALAQRPLPQTIIFADLPATTLDASPLSLSARASSMLEVSFYSLTLNTCSVNRNLLTLIRTGVCRVIARQEGNERYRRAFGVMHYFMVRPGRDRNPASGAGVKSGDKGHMEQPGVSPEITPKTSPTQPSTDPSVTPSIPPEIPSAKPIINPITDDTSGSGVKEEFYAIVTDQNHTPRQLIDADDRVVWDWNGEPFGSASPIINPGVKGDFVFNLRFPGQYFDAETHLHYNYYREYDSSMGRYVESDPIGLNGGINTYAYGLGNPISNTDPTGLFVPLVIPFVCAAGGCETLLAAGAAAALWWQQHHPITNNGTGVPEQSWPTFPPFDPTNTSGADKEAREQCHAAYTAQIEACKMTTSTPKAREACYARAANEYGQCIKKGCR